MLTGSPWKACSACTCVSSKRSSASTAIVAMLLVAFLAGSASADVISGVAPSGSAVDSHWFGESFTTPTGGSWDNLRFCLYDSSSHAELAFGDLFLLSQPYFGTPDDLSSSTPGFIAQSTGISNDMWTFASDVRVDGDTQYWFYGADEPTQSYCTVTSGSPPGGSIYYSTGATSNFAVYGKSYSYAYALTGTTVPEPMTMALLAVGGVGVLMRRRRR